MPHDPHWRRLYRLGLHALPRRFRERHGGELEQLLADRLADARRNAGDGWRAAAVWRRACTELADLAHVGARLRLDARRRGPPVSDPSFGGSRAGGSGLPVRKALRSLCRRPGFALLSVLTLALGVGASTAIFTAVDAILLRPLPHADADRLVMLWRVIPQFGFERGPASYPDYLDWRAESPALADLAAYSGAAGTLQSDAEPERLVGARVSGNLFPMLGNAPALGRVIVPEDDLPGVDRVIVLADGLWRRRFSADSAVIGRALVLEDVAYVVVGVMPPSFVFPSARAQFWIPLRMDPATAERDVNFLTLVGRLRPDATIDLAQAQVEAVAGRVAREHPGMNAGYGAQLERRRDYLTAPARPVLVLIAAAVAVLLAIALSNLVNLHLVRSAGRRHDRAVRRALGATGAHLAREQAAESLLIAVSGAAAGLGISIWLIAALHRLGLALPRASEIGIGGRAMAFAAGIAFTATAVGAAIGALVERRRSPSEVLAGGARSSSGRATLRTQEGLVVAQLALALALFIAAGLLGRSFYRLMNVPRGFDGAHVLTAKLSLPPARYGADRVLGFYDELLDRLSRLPGAMAVSGTWALPFSDDWASSAIVPADRPVPDDPPAVVLSPIRPRFFETAGIPLREGRDFTPADAADAPPVAIVNQTLAHRFWPGERPVGKQVRSSDPESDAPPKTIVGVVGDIKRRGLATPVEPEIYLPHAQATWTGDLYVTVRVTEHPHAFVPLLRRTIAELDPLLPITSVATLDELVDASVVEPRFRSLLVGSFAVIAGLLAAIGIYGVLLFTVAQRRHEIAVRAALGATPRRVLAEILGRTLRIASIGVGLGLLGSVAATPLLRALLFEIDPLDLRTYLAGTLLLATIAAAGSWIPARRAARVDPMLTLREEG